MTCRRRFKCATALSLPPLKEKAGKEKAIFARHFVASEITGGARASQEIPKPGPKGHWQARAAAQGDQERKGPKRSASLLSGKLQDGPRSQSGNTGRQPEEEAEEVSRRLSRTLPRATATNERLMTRSCHLSGLTTARRPPPSNAPSCPLAPSLAPLFSLRPSPPFVHQCIPNSRFYSFPFRSPFVGSDRYI